MSPRGRPSRPICTWATIRPASVAAMPSRSPASTICCARWPGLSSAHGLRRLVIAGDLFEDATGRALVPDLLRWLEEHGLELTGIVPGNHDRGLAQRRYGTADQPRRSATRRLACDPRRRDAAAGPIGAGALPPLSALEQPDRRPLLFDRRRADRSAGLFLRRGRRQCPRHPALAGLSMCRHCRRRRARLRRGESIVRGTRRGAGLNLMNIDGQDR